MPRLRIAEVHWLGERACSLRQHLKALAIQVRIGREVMRDGEQHYLLDTHGTLACVDQLRLAELLRPWALEFQGRHISAIERIHSPRRVTERSQARPGCGALHKREASA